MMSSVTPLITSVDAELIKKLFRKFSAVYGNLWNNRCSMVAEWQDCVDVWLDGLYGFDIFVLRKAVSQAFIAHKDFPPTLGQLVDLCLARDGVPSENSLIDLMVRKDFNHPLVKIIYEKIGSWALSHEKPDEINRKVCAVYSESLASYRENPSQAWKKLEEFKGLPAPSLIPSKIPSSAEISSCRERLKKYQEMADSQKANQEVKSHPVWEKGKITHGSRSFDEAYFNERKRYLLSVDEAVAGTLRHEDWYDRARYLRELEGYRNVQEHSAARQRSDENVSPRSPNGHRKAYKNWND